MMMAAILGWVRVRREAILFERCKQRPVASCYLGAVSLMMSS